MLSATDTPRADVLRYGCGYPLAIVLVVVATSLSFTGGVGLAVPVLLFAMLVSFIAFWWITRTGEVGGGRQEPSYGVHHVLTDDAQQRLRAVLFSLGVLLWGILGIGVSFWLISTFDFGSLSGPALGG